MYLWMAKAHVSKDNFRLQYLRFSYNSNVETTVGFGLHSVNGDGMVCTLNFYTMYKFVGISIVVDDKPRQVL